MLESRDPFPQKADARPLSVTITFSPTGSPRPGNCPACQRRNRAALPLQAGQYRLIDQYGSRLSVVVAHEDRKAANPFDKRRDVGLSELFPELQQIAFPRAKLLAVGNNVWTGRMLRSGLNRWPCLLPCMSRPAPGAMPATNAVPQVEPSASSGVAVLRVLHDQQNEKLSMI